MIYFFLQYITNITMSTAVFIRLANNLFYFLFICQIQE